MTARAQTPPEISVLLPAYNAAATLPATLDSLLAQTFGDFEIVAVDDGSTDETGAILHTYAARDARVRLIQQAHAGVVAAAQAGLLACRGALVARMDADDLAVPERLALQRDLLLSDAKLGVVGCLVENFPATEVRAGFRIYTEWLNSLVTPADIARDIFIESPLANPSTMMRRAELLALGGYQERGWPEDYDLWLRYHQAGWQFAKVPQVLLRWREHPARLTRTDSRYSVENFLRAKAHYLLRGPLAGRESLVIWGAGQMGRRLSKHLVRGGAPLVTFLDIDPQKIARPLRGQPVQPTDILPALWPTLPRPLVLVAVAARRARAIIRARLNTWGLVETDDFWYVA